MKTENSLITLDSFFKKEYKKLVNYVRKNMEARFYEASPEDIVQDVTLGLLGAIEVNTRIDNIAGYMYRAIKNKIIDTKKKKQLNISMENFTGKANENSLHSIPEETDNENKVSAAIEPEALHEAIARLKPDEQAVIVATEFEGITFEELSATWNIPIGTLLSRKHRALAKLSNIITDKNLNR